MFLANLEEEQKKSFLILAQAMVWADGVLQEEEISMMNQYQQEMGLPISTEIRQEPTEQALETFQHTTVSVKKQILIELMALAYSDNEYADEEQLLIKKIAAALELDADFLSKCEEYVVKLLDLYGRIYKLVGE